MEAKRANGEIPNEWWRFAEIDIFTWRVGRCHWLALSLHEKFEVPPFKKYKDVCRRHRACPDIGPPPVSG